LKLHTEAEVRHRSGKEGAYGGKARSEASLYYIREEEREEEDYSGGGRQGAKLYDLHTMAETGAQMDDGGLPSLI